MKALIKHCYEKPMCFHISPHLPATPPPQPPLHYIPPIITHDPPPRPRPALNNNRVGCWAEYGGYGGYEGGYGTRAAPRGKGR